MEGPDYVIARCAGEENVQMAIEERVRENPPWRLHSIVPAGLSTHKHPLDPTKALATMNYLVIFEREVFGA